MTSISRTGNQSYSEFESLFKLWKTLAKATGLPTPKRSQFMGEIDLSNQFHKWVNSNRPAVDQISALAFRSKVQVPQELGQITSLQGLFFCDNQFTEIPEMIHRLTGLQQLSVTHNQLTQLPSAFASLNLRILTLSYNQFSRLPHFVCSCTSLQQLDMTNNHLKELPYEIGQLTRLRFLRVGDNQLTRIPDSVNRLTSLVDLNLSINRLTEIPNLGSLTNLQHLDLTYNQLESLPQLPRNLWVHMGSNRHVLSSFKTGARL